MFKLTKRRRFVLSSMLLTLGLLVIHTSSVSNRYVQICVLSLFSMVLTFWSLDIPIKSRLWFLSWILPFLFTGSVSFFYFLLPASLLSLVPVLAVYLVGMYVLLLSENIFFVTSIRTIQLYRSATAVSFLFTLLTAFLLFDTILSFRLVYYYNFGLVYIFSFLLLLHACWTAKLEEGVSRRLLNYSLVLAWCVGSVALIISFWPVTISQGSLLMTAIMYVLVGLTQSKLNDRLFKKVVREYAIVGLIVLIVTIFSTRWG